MIFQWSPIIIPSDPHPVVTYNQPNAGPAWQKEGSFSAAGPKIWNRIPPDVQV